MCRRNACIPITIAPRNNEVTWYFRSAMITSDWPIHSHPVYTPFNLPDITADDVL